jgi:hypothetical protein
MEQTVFPGGTINLLVRKHRLLLRIIPYTDRSDFNFH